jgi:hypothetical protein
MNGSGKEGGRSAISRNTRKHGTDVSIHVGDVVEYVVSELAAMLCHTLLCYSGIDSSSTRHSSLSLPCTGTWEGVPKLVPIAEADAIYHLYTFGDLKFINHT